MFSACGVLIDTIRASAAISRKMRHEDNAFHLKIGFQVPG